MLTQGLSRDVGRQNLCIPFLPLFLLDPFLPWLKAMTFLCLSSLIPQAREASLLSCSPAISTSSLHPENGNSFHNFLQDPLASHSPVLSVVTFPHLFLPILLTELLLLIHSFPFSFCLCQALCLGFLSLLP